MPGQKFEYRVRAREHTENSPPLLSVFYPLFSIIMPPTRRKELSPTLRARICELRYSGMSYGKIAAQVSRLGVVVSRNLSDKMPKRVKAVIESEGWYTKY